MVLNIELKTDIIHYEGIEKNRPTNEAKTGRFCYLYSSFIFQV